MQVAMIMGISFVFQTAMKSYMGDSNADDDHPSRSAGGKPMSYEEALEKQKNEGGPRRYYSEGEGLDHESARVGDSDGDVSDQKSMAK